MITFTFTNPVNFLDGSSGKLDEQLTPDLFLTGVLFAPYLAGEGNQQQFSKQIEIAFTTAGALLPARESIRDVYYTAFAKWYTECQPALLKAKCFMSAKPDGEVKLALRSICSVLSTCSLVLQHYMVCKKIENNNIAIMAKEVANLCGYLRREHPTIVFDLFGYLLESVSALHNDVY